MRIYRVLIVVLVVVMALSIAAYAAPVESFDVAPAATEAENIDVSGDITGDGEVNISDVQALLKQVNGQSVIAAGCDTDVNGDGTVNISDVQLLLKYVNGQNVTIHGNSTGTVLIATGNGADTDTADDMTDYTNTAENESGNSSANDEISAESDSNHDHQWVVDIAGHWETETVVDNDAWEEQITIYMCCECAYFADGFETTDLNEMEIHCLENCHQYRSRYNIYYHEAATHEVKYWIDTTYYCSYCGASATADEVLHLHKWILDKEGYWEIVAVTEEEAWLEQVLVYVCRNCGFETFDEAELTHHEVSNGHGSTTKMGTIYHEATTCEVQQWVDATYYCPVCGAYR